MTVEQGVRRALLLTGVLAGLLAAGYFVQAPWAVDTFPWRETRLSNIFVASILAAVAGAMLWVSLAGRVAGAAGGFLHVATMAAGLAMVFSARVVDGPRQAVDGYTLGCWLVAASCVAAFAHARRLPAVDTRPVPRSLRIWAVLYILILLPAGAALLAQVPGIMPWPVRPEMSRVCGWVFLSAAWSFVYPLLRPQMEYMWVGLVGFLAYDAVLIMPFLQLLPKVQPALQNSLLLYLTALFVTAAVSLYYLFLSPATRLRSGPRNASSD
jgi:hypothetical protein